MNEIVDHTIKQKKECLIFKVDFEKDYDSVNWGYLENMMVNYGFCEKWISWMKATVFSGNSSVLVNGSPTSEFPIMKGIRQQDPLAPFLFLIAAEGLHTMITRVVESNQFSGFSFGSNQPKVTHLQYADDTIMVGAASWENLWSMKAIFRCFELIFGLKANFQKSSIFGLNVDHCFLMAAADFLHCRIDSLPFVYLGLPVGANPRRAETWRPIIDKVKRRLSSWKGKFLSFGGRVV